METLEDIRLTALASSAGCAAKMGPDVLSEVLRPLTQHHHPDLIVGLQTSDDAAVFRISDDLAIIQTVDFFPPVVDDPFAYGAISAANSMSDVYAMGGEVLFALNVMAFPSDLPREILSRILDGSAKKVVEAGGVTAGGHTVVDKEPKFGLSVTGRVHPDQIWTKAGAKPGDRLFLTKPIGTGVITTASKNRIVVQDDLDGALRSMQTLNRASAARAREFSPNACTDITGFSLLGHAFEVASKSGVGIEIEAPRVPLLQGALNYVGLDQVPGGLHRNRTFYSSEGVEIDPEIDADLGTLLYDPQTSGGLLFSVAAESADLMQRGFETSGLPLWEIGSVKSGCGVHVRR